MINNKIIQFLFIVLSILLVDLLLNYVMNYVLKLNVRWRTEWVTLIGMTTVVVILYVGIQYINRFSAKILQSAVTAGRRVLGHSIGAYAAFLIIYALLFVGFHFIWFARLPSARRLFGL